MQSIDASACAAPTQLTDSGPLDFEATILLERIRELQHKSKSKSKHNMLTIVYLAVSSPQARVRPQPQVNLLVRRLLLHRVPAVTRRDESKSERASGRHLA